MSLATDCRGLQTLKRAFLRGAGQVLHAAATLAHEFLVDKERAAPRALLDTAVYLHEIMLSLQGLQGIALQNVIAKVC